MPFVQAQLLVGSADDPLEREADEVSARVVASLDTLADGDHLGDAGPGAPQGTGRPSPIRRSVAMAAVGAAGGELDAATSSRIRRASGGGARLDPVTRSAMESGFGTDFSAVRIHTGGEASTLNAQLQAHAFTTGRDVFFGAGQYRPSSHVGRRLLAHELTHVVQQGHASGVRRSSAASRIRRAGTPVISTDRSTSVRRAHDSYNLDRLERARAAAITAGLCTAANKLTAVRLDHTMSDHNLRILATTLTTIWGRVSDARSPFESTRTAMQAVRAAIDELDEAALHSDWKGSPEALAGLLVNLRANLVPGLALTTGNPGSDFDAAVEGAQGGVYQSTAASDSLFKLDKAARVADRLSVLLPKGPVPRRDPPYDADLDAALGAALTKISAALQAVGQADEEAFDASLWEATTTPGKYVKKPAGVRLSAVRPPNFRTQLATTTPANVQATNMGWTIDVPAYDMGGGGAGQQVDVDLDIDMVAWQHIYDRHTLERFGASQPNQIGKVEATNTFWRADPYTTIDQAMLEREINLMVDRRFDLQAFVRNGATHEFQNVNGTAKHLFIQATMNLRRSPYSLDLSVKIKSLAPQHDALGMSVGPTVLAQW